MLTLTADKKQEAQRGCATSPGPHSSQQKEQATNQLRLPALFWEAQGSL